MNETLTLRDLVLKAKDSGLSYRQMEEKVAASEKREPRGLRLNRTTASRIARGTHGGDAEDGTIRAIALVAGVPDHVAFTAAGRRTNGPAFAEQLPAGIDDLDPRERRVALDLLRVLVAQRQELNQHATEPADDTANPPTAARTPGAKDQKTDDDITLSSETGWRFLMFCRESANLARTAAQILAEFERLPNPLPRPADELVDALIAIIDDTAAFFHETSTVGGSGHQDSQTRALANIRADVAAAAAVRDTIGQQVADSVQRELTGADTEDVIPVFELAGRMIADGTKRVDNALHAFVDPKHSPDDMNDPGVRAAEQHVAQTDIASHAFSAAVNLTAQSQQTYAQRLGLSDELLKHQYNITPGRDDGTFKSMWDVGYRSGHSPLIRAALAQALNVSNAKSDTWKGGRSFWREVARALDGGDGTSLKPAPPLPPATQIEGSFGSIGRRISGVRSHASSASSSASAPVDLDTNRGALLVDYVDAWSHLADACADVLNRLAQLRKPSLPFETGAVVSSVAGILKAVDDLFANAIEVDQGEDGRSPLMDTVEAAFRRVERAAGALPLAEQLSANANRRMTIDDLDVNDVVRESRVSTALDRAYGAYNAAFPDSPSAEQLIQEQEFADAVEDYVADYADAHAAAETAREAQEWDAAVKNLFAAVELVTAGNGESSGSMSTGSTRGAGSGGSKVLRATAQQSDDEWMPEAARNRPRGFGPQDPDAYDNTIGEESQDPDDDPKRPSFEGFHRS
ncbi:hypothetical protein WKY82_10350 [Gordonia malaquae]|uniref:hypothetical protein n=1 Tax=Gordonia malaquae TaxID=410332 RepID=UPI0030C78E8C